MLITEPLLAWNPLVLLKYNRPTSVSQDLQHMDLGLTSDSEEEEEKEKEKTKEEDTNK
jgi:hypothetical protein